jgi:3-dehydrosphinganine reductase
MHPSLPSIIYDASPTALGISAVFGALLFYTLVKMFGFLGRENQFVVEGRVSLIMASVVSDVGITNKLALQTVVITGGSEGMGKSVACQLAQKGANIVIVARTLQKLEDAIEAIKVRSP